MGVTVIPIIVGSLRTVSKKLGIKDWKNFKSDGWLVVFESIPTLEG